WPAPVTSSSTSCAAAPSTWRRTSTMCCRPTWRCSGCQEGKSPLGKAAAQQLERAAHARAPDRLHARLEALRVPAALEPGLVGRERLVLAADGVEHGALLVVQVLEQPLVIVAEVAEGALERLQRVGVALHVGEHGGAPVVRLGAARRAAQRHLG